MTDATALLDELLAITDGAFISERRRFLEVVEALRSCVPQWRTMESAPRDGTVFLAVNMRGGGTNRFELCFSAPCPEPQVWAVDAGWMNPGRDWPAYPTHWQPLPLPPSHPTLEGK